MNIHSSPFHEAGRPRFLSILAVFAALAIPLPAPAQKVDASGAPDAGNAQVKINHADIKNVPANSGQQMYAAYCAACHGATATGNGPASPALPQRPTDLTMLSARNKGKFPATRVNHVLTDVDPQRSNSSAQMPNWCLALRSLDGHNSNSSLLVDLRIHNLVSYLKTLQVPTPNVAPAQAGAGHQR